MDAVVEVGGGEGLRLQGLLRGEARVQVPGPFLSSSKAVAAHERKGLPNLSNRIAWSLILFSFGNLFGLRRAEELKAMLSMERLFPAEGTARAVAAKLYETVRDLPIISPHGHTDPQWFADNQPFPDPSALFIQPDHYIFRMLYSQGISLESLGVPQLDGKQSADPREVWRIFARNYYLFRGTPTRLWIDYAFSEQFGLKDRLSAENADEYYDVIDRKLRTPEFLPRALFESFRLEVLATTDAAFDSLEQHKKIKASGWKGRVLPTFRPDAVVDAEYAGFRQNLEKLGEVSGEDVSSYTGYLNALRKRRVYFKENGCTATDHGHLTAMTADLSPEPGDRAIRADLYGQDQSRRCGAFSGPDADRDGRHERRGWTDDATASGVDPETTIAWSTRSLGGTRAADIPSPTEYVRGLRPLLVEVRQ